MLPPADWWNRPTTSLHLCVSIVVDTEKNQEKPRRAGRPRDPETKKSAGKQETLRKEEGKYGFQQCGGVRSTEDGADICPLAEALPVAKEVATGSASCC